jgi:hypothetical protein
MLRSRATRRLRGTGAILESYMADSGVLAGQSDAIFGKHRAYRTIKPIGATLGWEPALLRLLRSDTSRRIVLVNEKEWTWGRGVDWGLDLYSLRNLVPAGRVFFREGLARNSWVVPTSKVHPGFAEIYRNDRVERVCLWGPHRSAREVEPVSDLTLSRRGGRSGGLRVWREVEPVTPKEVSEVNPFAGWREWPRKWAEWLSDRGLAHRACGFPCMEISESAICPEQYRVRAICACGYRVEIDFDLAGVPLPYSGFWYALWNGEYHQGSRSSPSRWSREVV